MLLTPLLSSPRRPGSRCATEIRGGAATAPIGNITILCAALPPFDKFRAGRRGQEQSTVSVTHLPCGAAHSHQYDLLRTIPPPPVSRRREFHTTRLQFLKCRRSPRVMRAIAIGTSFAQRLE